MDPRIVAYNITVGLSMLVASWAQFTKSIVLLVTLYCRSPSVAVGLMDIILVVFDRMDIVNMVVVTPDFLLMASRFFWICAALRLALLQNV